MQDAYDNLLETTSSIASGIRLNGSVVSDSKCDLIVDRSMVVRDVGSMTGSLIMENMSGSGMVISSTKIMARSVHT